MRKKKILFGLIVLLCVVAAINYYPKMMKNEPGGFRGIPWHATVLEGSSDSGQAEGLTGCQLGEFISCKVYERKNESLLLGGAVIDSVVYLFDDSMGFVSAIIYFKDRKNFELISMYCVEHWGSPASKRRQAEASGAHDFAELSWRGRKAETMLWYSGNTNLGALHIYLKKSFAAAKEDFNQMLENDDYLLSQSLD